jgi:biotin/methionine sulfoxide reductase
VRRADIVLPSTSALERDDMMINSRDGALIYMSPALPRFAEARDDHAIFAALADRMGVGARFTEGRDTEGWLRWLWDGCRDVARDTGLSLPDFEKFREDGRIDLPAIAENRESMADFIADPDSAPLRTESGRITLFNRRIAAMALEDCPGHPTWMAPTEWLGTASADELHLISGQPKARLHSQLNNGDEVRSRKRDGREVATLHPETAARIGAGEGDVLRLWNARGACLASLHVSEDIRVDCIALPTGAWFDPQEIAGTPIEVHGNPNVLTLDIGASALSQGNIGHTSLVRVERWTGQTPEIAVLRAPLLSQAIGSVREEVARKI